MTQSDNDPSLETLRRVQLFRTTLVNFLPLKNFTDAVTGLYVRVLLEMRGEDARRESTGGNVDSYYVARIKGTQKGPSYSGFSADSATTDWLLVIELPPTFRSTENGNVVQLNSISNSPFKESEYKQWLCSVHTLHVRCPNSPQLHLLMNMLEENKQRVLAVQPRRRRANPANSEKKTQLRNEIAATYLQVPLFEQLNAIQLDELKETERKIFDLSLKIRQAINERENCILCKAKTATEICYPCKHQVLCKDCASKVKDRCPVPSCNKHIEFIFAPYAP